MTALPGAHPEQLRQPVAAIVEHLAHGLRALHSIAVTDCPFDETTPVRLARAEQMIARGEIHNQHFDERNRRLSPLALYPRLVATMPQPDLVVVHGDATFDNILIDATGHIGFIDCGHAGRGDRYLDLEAVTNDIAEAVCGAELILCPTPAFAQPDIARRLAPTSERARSCFFLPQHSAR